MRCQLSVGDSKRGGGIHTFLANLALECVAECIQQGVVRLQHQAQGRDVRLDDAIWLDVRQHDLYALAQESEPWSLFGAIFSSGFATATESPFLPHEDLRPRGYDSYPSVVVCGKDGADEVVREVERARWFACGIAHKQV